MITDTAVVTQFGPPARLPWHRRMAPWALALIPFIAVAVKHFLGGSGIDQDDSGQYLMHAQALAQGRPYADIGYIYSPLNPWIGPRMAPPGLPLMLAAIYRVLGPNLFVMKLAMVCFAVAFVALAGLYFARHDGRRIGLAVALLCGLSPAIAHGSSQILSDLPFAALLWGVLYLMDAPGELTVPRMLAVTFLGSWAMLFRVTGVALVPALAIFTVLHYRSHGWRSSIPLLIWLGGTIVLALATDVEKATLLRLRPQIIASWVWDTRFGILNVRDYAGVVFDSHLSPFTSTLANDAFHVVTGLLMAIGLWAWLPHAWPRFGTIFGLTYVVMLLITPFTQARYIWPLFPFFVFAVLNGVRVIAERVFRAAPDAASLAPVAFALAMVPIGVVRAMPEPAEPELMSVPEVQDVVAYMTGVEEQPVRAMFYKPRSFAWATGIPTMGPIFGEEPCLLSELTQRRITHVIVGSLDNSNRGFVKNYAKARPDRFSLRYSTQHFAIYQFHAPGGAELERAWHACTQSDQ